MLAEWRQASGGQQIIVTGSCRFIHERFISTPRAEYADRSALVAGYMLSAGLSGIVMVGLSDRRYRLTGLDMIDMM